MSLTEWFIIKHRLLSTPCYLYHNHDSTRVSVLTTLPGSQERNTFLVYFVTFRRANETLNGIIMSWQYASTTIIRWNPGKVICHSSLS